MATGSSYGQAQMNRMILKIVKDIVSETGKDAMTSDIYSRAIAMGIDDLDLVDRTIQILSNDTQLLMARPGHWRPH